MMKKETILKILLLSFYLIYTNTALAQLSITTADTDFTINFDTTVAGVNNGTFAGTGFKPTPDVGNLDADAWKITGFTPFHNFGNTSTTGDLARGSSTGNVITGGLYAFEVSASNYAMGVQPEFVDFNPGSLTLKITNNTGAIATAVTVTYDVWVLNNEGKSSKLTLDHGSNGIGFSTISSTKVTTPEAADGSPVWVKTTKSAVITGLSIADGSNYYFGWSGGDVAGAGERDEMAIDNLTINLNTAAAASTWTGTVSSSWDELGNWSDGVPGISTNVTIPVVATNYPTVTGASTKIINDLTLAVGTIFNMSTGTSLTVSGNFSNSNTTFNISSKASIIVKGTTSGEVSYFREIKNTNWSLVASPVSGEKIGDYKSNSLLEGGGSGNNIAFAQYITSSDSWDYYESPANDAFSINISKGYATNVASANNDILFTGTILASDTGNGLVTTGNKFNLLGNPYPSYLPANENADATNNILTVNSAILEEETIWFWDGTLGVEGEYVTLNQASASRFLAPAQGFFVKASAGGGSFSFTESMQSHQIDVFSRTTNTRFETKLIISDGTTTKSTEIYFINGTTTSFDNGYDSTMFNGVANEFQVYTNLVSDSQGQNLAIQSLPTSNYENMVIPIGVKASTGTQVTFSIETSNIPEGYMIFLEDRETNTFTRLDEINSNYQITLTSALNDIGRFYLHTTSQRLLVENEALQNISMYLTNTTNLRIVGIPIGKTSVQIFSVLGKKVMATSFESNGVKNLKMPVLTSGIYIIQLQTDKEKLSKKIIIE